MELKIKLLLILSLVLSGCKDLPINSNNLTNEQNNTIPVQRQIGEDESAFYDELDKRALLAGEKSLRKNQKNQAELEVRVWSGFSLTPASGVIFRKRDSHWQAIYLPPLEDSDKKKKAVSVREPTSGWEAFWAKLENQGILSLPDDSVVGAVEPFPDSSVVFVEIRGINGYRHYSYNAPCLSKADEGKRLVDILATISSDLNIDLHECSSYVPQKA